MKEEIFQTSQYLSFKLGDETFALDVINVREVLDLTTITKVPGTPEFMSGVINVRGSVVPVMDLKLRFGLPDTEQTKDTRIIVMEVNFDGDEAVLSTLADSVEEVIDLRSDQIDPPPRIGQRWQTEFVKGIGKENDRFLIILDIDKIFSSEDLEFIESEGVDLILDDEQDEP